MQAEQVTRRERTLLVLAGIFITLNHVTLIIVQERSILRLWIVGIWVGCAWGLHKVSDRRLPYRDSYLLPTMMLLVGWGINTIDRLAPAFADREAMWLIFSSLIFGMILYLPHDLNWLRSYRYTWLVLGLGLLIVTILLGVNPSGGGPRLWLDFGRVFYQPSELLKILLVVFMASYLADHWLTLRHEFIQVGFLKIPLPAMSFFAPILLMWGLCMVILIWQRDLGTATLFFVVFMLMLYLASGQEMLIVGGTLLLSIAGFVAYLLFDVVALRIEIWLNPWAEPEGRAFQLVQSLMAISAGGVMGQGIGEGLPTAIPVVHSDFIFAAIAEEWGLIGVLSLLICLAVIIIRGLKIAAQNQQHPFIALLSAGLSLMLAIQSILIMAGSTRLLPLTGITLPFVSYGGSALLTSFMMVGLLLVLSGERPA
jgi:cell division protein FtsW (lipid II flippase)